MTLDDQLLEALAAARSAADPDNEGLYAFYEALTRAIATHRDSLSLTVSRLYEHKAAQERARADRPHLQFDALRLEPDPFYDWVQQVGAIFDAFDPGAAEEIAALDPADLLDLARLWYESGSADRGPTLDGLLANGMAPYLQRAAVLLLPKLPMHLWNAAYCPLCGGYPDFSAYDPRHHDHELVCERCQATWEIRYPGCLFCGESDPDLRGFYASEDGLYRVDVCDSCGHYLKMLNTQESRKLQATPRPQVDRLLTPGLDLLAAQEGYERPQIFDHGQSAPEDEDGPVDPD